MNSENIAAIRQSAVTHKHIAGGEQIARATIGAINAPGLQLEGVDWVDCVVERCRFSGATLIDSRFEGVLFHDCDFTGLTFANCLLRDCVIVGIRSAAHMAMDNCILDGLSLYRSSVGSLEVSDCRIGELTCVKLQANRLGLRNCQRSKRSSGVVAVAASEIAQIVGLDGLAQAGIGMRVDGALWREMGDSLLRERGVELVPGQASDTEDQLEALLAVGRV